MVVATPLMVVATGVTVEATLDGLTVIHGSRPELSVKGNDVSMCNNWRNCYEAIPRRWPGTASAEGTKEARPRRATLKLANACIVAVVHEFRGGERVNKCNRCNYED